MPFKYHHGHGDDDDDDVSEDKEDAEALGCRSHKIYVNRSQLSLLFASWYQSSTAAAELSCPAISAKHSVLVGIWHRVLPSNLIVHQTLF